MIPHAPTRIEISRLRLGSLLAGLAGLVLCIVALFVDRRQFFRAYLMTYYFWLCITLGAQAILMIFHVTGGRWGFLIQRIMEAIIRTTPLMALLFIPVFFGLHDLYEWADPAAVAASPHLLGKHAYLNVPGYILRSILYFACWLIFSRLLVRGSLELDRTGDMERGRRLFRLSAGGLIVYTLTVTFASFDWFMSLEPEWYSTIYGAIHMTAQALEALAFAAIVIYFLSPHPALARVSIPAVMNDVGNMILAFVVLWVYMAFSNYLLIWQGDIAEEITWILRRTKNGWNWAGLSIIVFHFFVPFFLLLFRWIKRAPERLAIVAGLLLFMRLVATWWLITPAFYSRIYLNWMDWVSFIAVGGFWLATFVHFLAQAPLVPLHSARFENTPMMREAGHV